MLVCTVESRRLLFSSWCHTGSRQAIVIVCCPLRLVSWASFMLCLMRCDDAETTHGSFLGIFVLLTYCVMLSVCVSTRVSVDNITSYPRKRRTIRRHSWCEACSFSATPPLSAKSEVVFLCDEAEPRRRLRLLRRTEHALEALRNGFSSFLGRVRAVRTLRDR